MKFGLMGVGSGSTVRPDTLTQIAQKGEELGFESAWIPEHLAVPVKMEARYPGAADGKFPGGPGVALHDPFVALSFVAGQTKTIKLGTGVFVLPLRNTLGVAKAVASLDVLSGGRMKFGIGVGWCEEEFDAVGMPFKNRTGRTREAVKVMRALWTEETPQFDGKYHKFDPIGFNPKPIQKPGPPLIFGGESRAALKRTAELADGWCGIRYTPESIMPYLATLRELCQECGRDFSRLEITAGIEPGLPLTLDAAKQFEDAGVQRLFAFSPGWMRRSRFDSELYPQMERFANDVIAKI